MKLVETTIGEVPVGGTFYGKGSKDRYTKIGRVAVRPEEGPGKGDVWIMKEDSTVLVEAPQPPTSQQDEIWYDSLAAAPVKERKPWRTCFLCEYRQDEGACDDCDDCYSEWSPCKPMLEWHKSLTPR
jgi:hypothetical protein